MDFSIVYEFLPTIKFCKVRLDKDQFLNYKKNDYFIEALKIIGKNYGRVFYGDNKMTDYKLGIKYVRECTAHKYKIIVSKSQIKRLARPHCRKRRAMKFPVITYEIITTVRTLIDNNNQCVSECKACKKEYCERKKQKNILCRDFLIGGFYNCIRVQRGQYNTYSYSEKLLNALDNDLHNCNI
jgi:hypothetical protein|nr:MAG TPA: hypothetical protein [Caudoviricetes sp.]